MRQKRIHFQSVCLRSALLAIILVPGCRQADLKTYEFRAPGITAVVDNTGAICRVEFTGPNLVRAVRAFTKLRDCEPDGRVKIVRNGAEVSFIRKWVSMTAGHSCLVTDRFSPGSGSLRWEVEVTGLDGPWSTPIETWLVYPDSTAARFWTAWGDPRLSEMYRSDKAGNWTYPMLDRMSPSERSGNWSDPLVPVPFVNDTIWYGAPPFSYDNPGVGFVPFQGNIFGIPLVTISENQLDTGLSLILSPEDTLLDLSLRVRSSGEMVFSRDFHRISSAATIRFRLDLVAHESGWRGGLRWMTINYPGFFDPNVPLAHDISGTGAYSSLETAFDLEKMRRMAFGVNWKASFDFPYMGMFIPPVESDATRWRRYGGGTTSIGAMRDIFRQNEKPGVSCPELFQRDGVRRRHHGSRPAPQDRSGPGPMEERRRFSLRQAGRGDPTYSGGRDPGQNPSLWGAGEAGRPLLHVGARDRHGPGRARLPGVPARPGREAHPVYPGCGGDLHRPYGLAPDVQ